MPKMIQIYTTGKIGRQTGVIAMKSIDIFLEHIENICGSNSRFFEINDEGEQPPLCVVSYAGVPEEGCITAFSFGLSSIPHKEWSNSRPELVISINSLDTAWPLAMGELIRNGRDHCLFSYGMVLNFGQAISDESEITCFLVYECTVLQASDLSILLPDRNVHLSQIYPVYQSEVNLIMEVGPERFVHHLGIDLFDIRRPPQGKV
jgi:hypothetical protein